MAGETTVVSPWPQQIFHEDGDARRGGYAADALKTRTFAISQQMADNFAAERVKAAHVDVLKSGAETEKELRKEINQVQYAVYALAEKVTAQAGEMKALLLQQENERLRDRLLARRIRRNRDGGDGGDED